MISPPPGSWISSRRVVVWRPLPSLRSPCVARSSSPMSVFTIVDLPTPDEPSRTAVTPGVQERRQLVEPRTGDVREREHGHAAGDRLHFGDGGLRGGVEVGLRQHDHGPRAALPREDEVALEPAQVEVLVHRRDEEADVDVRREHLLLGRLPGRLAGELREARQDGGDRARTLLRRRARRRPSRRRPGGRRCSPPRGRGGGAISQRSSPCSVSTS